MSNNFKLTVSRDHLLPVSHILQPNGKHTIKKAESLDIGVTGTAQKSKMDSRAFNVKLVKYKSMQQQFVCACNNLVTSYESVKNVNTNPSADTKYDLEQGDELDTTVKDIIEKQFGIQFPRTSAVPFKKEHQSYVTSVRPPPTSFIVDDKSTSGDTKFRLAVKEAYEYVSKIVSEIADVNNKYSFWLEMINRPDEFSDLDDVRVYLVLNMFGDRQPPEQLEITNYFNGLQCKLIDIVNEAEKVLEPGKRPTANDNDGAGKKDERTELDDIERIKAYKHKMDVKMKMLEAENEKLKSTETEFCNQIKALLGELAFRNRKLMNTKECLAVLTKEKNDLISMIRHMEVKEEGFQLLKKRIEKEEEKNNHLRNVIEEEYEKKFGTSSSKIQ